MLVKTSYVLHSFKSDFGSKLVTFALRIDLTFVSYFRTTTTRKSRPDRRPSPSEPGEVSVTVFQAAHSVSSRTAENGSLKEGTGELVD